MLAVRPHSGGINTVNALPVGIDKRHRWTVVGLQVFVVKARSLAQLPVPRLQRFCGRRVGDDRINPCPNLFHLFVVGLFVRSEGCFGAEFGSGHHPSSNPIANPLRNVGPAIHHKVNVGISTCLQQSEVSQPLALPPRLK